MRALVCLMGLVLASSCADSERAFTLSKPLSELPSLPSADAATEATLGAVARGSSTTRLTLESGSRLIFYNLCQREWVSAARKVIREDGVCPAVAYRLDPGQRASVDITNPAAAKNGTFRIVTAVEVESGEQYQIQTEPLVLP